MFSYVPGKRVSQRKRLLDWTFRFLVSWNEVKEKY